MKKTFIRTLKVPLTVMSFAAVMPVVSAVTAVASSVIMGPSVAVPAPFAFVAVSPVSVVPIWTPM